MSEVKESEIEKTEEEIEKAQKLEAARKKFEELKKKKKKGGKKNKKKAAVTEDETESKEGTPAVEDDGTPDKETAAEDSTVNEETPVEDETKEEPTVEVKEESKVEVKQEPKADIKKDSNEVKEEEEKSTAAPKSDSVSDLFNNDGNTLLEDILSSNTPPQESEFLTSALKSQIEELTKKLRESDAQVSQLKEENSELKLTQMDLEEEIEALKQDLERSRLETTKLKFSAASVAASAYVPQHHNLQQQNEGLALSEDDNNSIFSTGITSDFVKPSPSFQNFSNFANKSNDYIDIVDVKERLTQWKGWNVDMREWRTVGMGPVLEL